MKTSSCLHLLGAGLLTVGLAIAAQFPGAAKPKVTVTTTTPNNTGATVVPVVPSNPGTAIAPLPGAPVPGAMICVPGTPTPCAQPQPIAQDYFFCGQGSHNIPTTFVNTPNGNLPLIRWKSHYFEPSGYSPEVRCRDVSQRFNRFYNQGTLNFITTGMVNNQPVVCVASTKGGPCTEVLFTLKSGQNATRTIQQLFDVRVGASGPLFESEERIYIDMRPYTAAIQAYR